MILSESELILNPDGSVYHLGLLPQDIAHTVITVGDPERVGTVSQYFETVRVRKAVREFVTHTGTYRGKELTVISTGIGTDNIDIVINELDALVNIDLKSRRIKEEKTSLTLIRLGTSGSIDAHIATNQILLSESALGLDGLMHFYPDYQHITQNKQSNKLAYWAYPDRDLLQRFEKIFPLKGNTLTANGFYAPQGRSIRLRNSLEEYVGTQYTWNNIPLSNIEMETSGIYGLGFLLGHKTLSINALLANRINGEFSDNPKEIVEQMIVRVLNELSQPE